MREFLKDRLFGWFSGIAAWIGGYASTRRTANSRHLSE